MNENTKLWDEVCRTDPTYTRKVKYGAREFTDINSTYRTHRVTQQFGPCGKGWGYDAQHSFECLPNNVVVAVCDVILWWREDGKGEKYSFGPVRGTNIYLSAKGHVDEDAPKKALTDAKTKAFSDLGESADVYIGRFDDSRYVQERTQAVQRDAMSESAAKLEELKAKLPTLVAKPHALNWAKKHKSEIDSLTPQHLMQFKVEFQGRLDELRTEHAEKKNGGMKQIGDIMPSPAEDMPEVMSPDEIPMNGLAYD